MIDVNLVQLANKPLPNVSTFDKFGSSVIAEPVNASSPMEVTVSGKLIVFNFPQFAKPLLSIVFNDEWELSIPSRFEQPSKVEIAISSSVSGKSM